MLFNQFFQQGVSGIPSQNISVTTGFEYTHRIFGINTEGIDWGRPVELNQDIAKEFGIVAYYPGWPRGVGALYDIGNYRTHGVFASGAAPSWVNGKFGDPALSYVPNQYVEVQPGQALNTIGSVTIALWVLRSGSDAAFQRCVFKNSSNGNHYVWGLQLANNGKAQFACTSADNTQYDDRWVESSGSIIQSSGWKFLVATYNASTSTATIYIDGVYDTSGTPGTFGANNGTLISGNLISSTGTLNFARLRYNAADGGASYYSTNIIGNTLICNKALTASQVYRLYTTPYLAAWQPSTKTYFLPTNIIDSAEVVSESTNVAFTEIVRPAGDDLIFSRPSFGSNTTKQVLNDIDWSAPVELDQDLANEFGVVTYISGWPNTTVLKDHGKYRNNGVLVSGADWTTGKFGEPSIHLTGNSPGITGKHGYVSNNSGSLDFTSAFSVSVWVNVYDTTANVVPFGKVVGGSAGWMLYSENTISTPWAFFVYGLSVTNVATVTYKALNRYYHVVGVYDGSNLKIYLDGVLEASTAVTGTPTTTTQNCWIGKYCTALGDAEASNFLNGAVSQPTAYNKALTASQVARLYNDPLLLAWQPSNKMYSFPLLQGIDSSEVVSDAASISLEDIQIIRPVKNVDVITKPAFGSEISTGSLTKINWDKPVELNKELASELKLTAYLGVWPSGTNQIHDLGSNKFRGTLVGSNIPNWATGKFGEPTIKLNGTNNYISVPTNTELDLLGDAWFSTWWTPSAITSQYYTFGAKYDGVTQPYNFFYSGTTSKLGIYFTGSIPDAAIECSTTVTFTLGTTYHLLWTLSGTTLYAYVNGQSVGSASCSGTRSANTAAMTLGQTNNGNWVNGSISNIAFGKRFLEQSTVSRLYNDPLGLAWQPSSKTYYLPIYQGIDSEEALSDVNSLTVGPEIPQWVYPAGNVPIIKQPFGSEKPAINWSNRVEIDYDIAQDYGTLGYWIGTNKTTLYDLTANGNHATTFTTGATPSFGKFGEPVINYNGTDGNRVYIPNAPSYLKPSRNFSAGCWFLIRTIGAPAGVHQYPIFIGNDTQADLSGWFIGLKANTGEFGISAPNLSLIYTTQTYIDSTWHFGMVTVSSGATATVKLYVDGNLLTTSTTTEAFTGTHTDIQFGADITGGGHGSADGKLSQIGIFNRVLSDVEIRDLYINPGKLLYQKSTKTYFMPIGESISSEEVVSDPTNVELGPPPQVLYPAGNVPIIKQPFGSEKPAIDWTKNVELDYDIAQDYGVLGYWIGTNKTTLYDLTANGNHATAFTTGATPSIGKFGEPVINYNGTDGNRVYIPNAPSYLKPSRNFSAGCWFLIRTIGASGVHQYPIFIGNDTQADLSGWFIGLKANTGEFGISAPNLSLIYTTKTFIDSSWHFGMVTVSSGATATVKLYVDGNLLTTSTTTEAFTGTHTDIQFGADITGGGHGSADGKLSKLGIFNRVLSDVEIRDLYINPGKLLYQKSTKTYFMPIGESISSEEVVSDPTNVELGPPPQVLTPATDFAYTRVSFGSAPFGSSTGKTVIDWNKPIGLNWDLAKSYGVVDFWPGYPAERSDFLYNLFGPKSSGANYRGVFSASPAWMAGKNGENAYVLNGSNYIDIGAGEYLGQNLSISLWVRPQPVSTYRIVVSRGGGNASSRSYMIYLTSTGEVNFSLTNGWYFGAQTTKQIANGTWGHIVATLNTTDSRVYLDGVLDVIGTTGVPDNVAGRSIGCYGNAFADVYAGAVSLLTICNRALTASEASNLYNDPFALIWQAPTKTYFLPTSQGIDSTEVVSEAASLDMHQMVRPANEFAYTRAPFGSPYSTSRVEIDWNKPVELDRDKGQEYGVVAYYPLWPHRTSLFYNVVDNKYHGSLVAGPTWTIGKYGEPVLDFDGVDDRIDGGSNNALGTLSNASSFTLIANVVPKAPATVGNHYLGRYVTLQSVTNDWNCGLQIGGGYDDAVTAQRFGAFTGKDGVSSNGISTSVDFTLGKWYQHAATFNGSTYELFVDGTSVASGSYDTNCATATANSNGLSVGCTRFNGANQFVGFLALTGVILSNKILSAAKLTQLYYDPFLLAWQPKTKTYYFPIYQGVDSEEVVSDAVSLAQQDTSQTVYPAVDTGIPKSIFGYSNYNTSRKTIDWWSPIELDKDVAQEYGILSYYPGWPSKTNSVYDLSGQDNRGKLYNSPTWSTGRFGEPSLDFVGASSQYVERTGGAFPTQYPLWISCWTKTSGSTNNSKIGGYGNSVNDSRYMVFSYDSSSTTYFGVGSSNGIGANLPYGSINDGQWRHLFGISRSATQHEFYVNGELASTSNTNVPFPDLLNSFTIGAFQYAGIQGYYTGSVANFMSGSGNLSVTQIGRLYRDPFLPVWQPSEKTYFLPASQGIDSAEVVSEAASLDVHQMVRPASEFAYTRPAFGSPYSTSRVEIDWNKPVELDKDKGQEYGVVAYYPLWPHRTDLFYNVANNKYHGNLVSGPTWTIGKYGEPVLDFDGVDDRIDGGSTNALGTLSNSSSFTLIANVVPKAAATVGNHYLGRYVTFQSVTNDWNCGLQIGGGYDSAATAQRFGAFTGKDGVSSVGISASADFTLGRWCQHAATFNGSTYELFVDGTSVASGSYDTNCATATANSNGLSVGCTRFNGANQFVGFLALTGVILSNKILSAAKLTQLYYDPFLLAWQPKTKTYYFPIYQGIDTEEVVSEADTITLAAAPVDQTIAVGEEVTLTRPAYGSGVTSVSKKSAFKEIDWGAPVSLNYDMAKEYGLIAYYPGWPSNLTDWRDISGNGYHAALVAQASWTTGKFSEYGLKFDGVDDYALLSMPNVLSSSFTILSWLKFPSTQTELNVWATSTVSGYTNYWIALTGGYLVSNRIRANLFDGTNNPGVNSVSTINDNTWYHCGMVRNVVTDTIGVVVNGVIEATTTDTTTSVPAYNAFKFGGQAQGSFTDRFTSCSLSGASIFSKALTDSQITKIYNDPFALLWQPSSTTYFFPVGTGIITEEAFGEITILNPEAQSVQPCVSLELERAPFGSTICPASSGRKAIDWGEPVELDKDMAQEYGVVAYYPSWPSKTGGLYDLGKSRAHARLNGSSWGMGPFGEPAIVSNTGQYTVASSSLNDYGITNKLTFGCWIKLNSTGQTNKYCISNANTGAPYDDFSLIYGYTANKFEIYSESYTGTAPRTAMTTSINDTLWRHIAWTYDGANVVGYINGIADVTSAKTFSFSTRAASRFSIGDPNAPAQTADMTVSGYFCCNKAITASEMFRLYNDPFLLAWQPTSKTYYLPIYQGIDSEEALGDDQINLGILTTGLATTEDVPQPVVIPDQFVYPNKELVLPRVPFGSSVSNNSSRKEIDWTKPVELDKDRAQEYGVVSYYSGWPSRTNIIYDISKNARNGSFVNSPTWTAGKFGEPVISLDGTNRATANSPISAYPFSIAAWARPQTVTGTRVIASISLPGVTTNHALFINSATGISADSYNEPAYGVATSSGTPAIGTWLHAAGVWRSSISRFAAMNNNLSSTDTTSVSIGSVTTTTIGAYNAEVVAFPFIGEISNLVVGNVAWTAAQIAELYYNPFLLAWQPSTKTYYLPIYQGIDTGEVVSEADTVVLDPAPQYISPDKELILPRVQFGYNTSRKEIDWTKPVELDKDKAQEYGVTAYWPGWPDGTNTLYDLGANKHNGTFTNGPTWTRGKFGEPALKIGNLSTQYVATPSAVLNMSEGYFSGFVIKTSATASNTDYVIFSAFTNANDRMFLEYATYTNGTVPYFVLASSTVNTNDVASDYLSVGVYYHIFCQWKNGVPLELYVDTVKTVSLSNYATQTTAAVQLGNYSAGSSLGLGGNISLPTFGNKMLTASQITKLYNDPFLLAWQPSTKNYFLPIYQGIDSEEVVNEITILNPEAQYISPDKELILPRVPFGYNTTRKEIDWNKPIEIDRDRAQEYGIIAYYPGWPNNGTTLRDVNANRNGDLSIGPDWTTGKFCEPALQFNGSDDRAYIDSICSATTGSKGFYSAWLKVASSGATNKIIAVTNGGLTNPVASAVHFGIRTNVTPGNTIRLDYTFVANEDTNIFGVHGSTALSTGTWYHGLIQSSGSAISLWLNGMQETSTTWVDTLTLGNDGRWWDDMIGTPTYARIGNCWYKGVEESFFAGSIASPIIGNKALTADQIFQLYSNPFLLAWQPSTKNYFLPIYQGIDSEEALGSDQINLSVLTTGLAPTEIVGDHIVSLEATDQYVYPNEQFEINRIPFGNVDGINWGENISIDTETMREHGVVQYYPQLPAHRRQDRYIDVVSGIRNGTIFGGVAYVWDKFGGPALEFDGSNGYVLLNNCDLKASGSITMWWKPNELDDSPIFTAVAGPQSFYIYPISTSFVVGWQNGGNNDQQTWSMSGISIGEWYHVAVTWENSGPTKLYINGQLKLSAGTTDAQWNTTGATTCIGAYDTSAANAAIAISGLTIHNRPISQSEVNDLYSLPHQYLRAGRKTYYFSTAKGIDSAEATGDPIVTLTAPDQTVYPDKELVLPRKPFGSPFGSIPTDWATSTLNEDRAKQYGVQAYFAGWPNQAFDVRDIKGRYRSVAATGGRTTGKFNEPATTFNGSTNHINFGDVLNVGANDFALSLWVNLRSNGDYCIASKGNNSGLASGYKSGWYLLTNSSGQVRWSLYTESTAQWAEVTSTTSLRLNTWEHIVVTRSSSTGTIYCNGVPMGQTTTQAGTWSGNVDTLSSYYIGTYDNGPSLAYYLPGSISNFIHMNKIPTAGEIKNLYDNPFDLIEQTNKTYFLPVYQGIDSEEVVSTGDQLNLSVIMTGIATSYVSGDAVILADQDIDTSSINSAYVSGDHQLNLTLIQTGIATGYVSGDHQLNLTLIQTGIATGYVSGDHQLNLTVIMTGIASTESISSIHEVAVGTIFIEPSGIGSAYVSGDHQLNLTLLMTGITTGYLSGDALVLADQKIVTTGISTSYVSGDHSVNYTIAPSGIGTAYVSGDHQLNLTLIQTGITTGYVSGDHQLNLTVLMTGIATAESISSVHEVVVGTIFIEASGIGSAYASGDHQLNLTLFMTGITTGYLSGTAIVYTTEYVTVSSIDSSEMVGSHRVNYSISTTSIDSVEIFGSHQLNLKIFASPIGTSELMGTTVVIREQFISTSGIATAYVSGDHSFKYIITPSGIATAGSVNSPTINSNIHMTGISTSYASGSTLLSLTLFVSGIDTSEAVGSQIVRRDFAVAPSGIATTEIFGSHQLNLTIIGSSIASTNIFGSLIVIPGGVSVIPNGIDSTEVHGVPLVNANLTVIPPGLDSDEVVNQVLIGTGISPAGITSSEQIGIHLIELQPYIGFFASTYVGYNFNTPMF